MKTANIIQILLALTVLSACVPSQAAEFPTAPVITNEDINIKITPASTPTGVEGELKNENQKGSLEPTKPFPAASTPDSSAGLPPSSTPEQQGNPEPAEKPTRVMTSNAWKGLPVIPKVSENVQSIYQRGIELGRNPNAYSKIGDCGSTPTWFLGDFDRGPEYYDLGEHTYLTDVIQEFSGSHERVSLGARAGFNAPSLFVSLWSDIEYCQPDEGPLECEFRVHQPIMAFIMLGANDIWHPDEFEPNMRKIIEHSIDNGVIPILSTKADNQEGDGSINFTIARLAQEYDIPVINFWRAVQDLPDKGLQEDGVHMTWGKNDFADPKYLKTAWTIRNLTALQTLDAVWQTASGLGSQ